MTPYASICPLPDCVASTRNNRSNFSPRIPRLLLQSKKVAVAGGDASIRIIDIVEEKAADVY